ncbi:MAG: GNAT family N-acetyltransferase [Myxococcota bacterium]|nr:GNAT family N-acetyltransferase [Myxococcota bacterium]
MRSALWPHAARTHPGEIDAFLAGAREDAETFVAEAGDPAAEAVGFAEVRVRGHAEGCRSPRVAYLEGWWVAPARRRSGVGAALLRAVEAWARARGLTELASDAELANPVGQAAHEALGFAEVERQVCYRKPL